jgi:Transposase
MRCGRGSVGVVCPPVLPRQARGREERDAPMHRPGRAPRVRPGRHLGGRRGAPGRTDPADPEGLRDFAASLCASDQVAIEATGNTYAIARLLERHVGRVVVSNPQKTRAIAEAKVKTDKVDAAVLAGLLAADYLPAVWLPDEATFALRRRVTRRAHIVRQRTRLQESGAVDPAPQPGAPLPGRRPVRRQDIPCRFGVKQRRWRRGVTTRLLRCSGCGS